jgi:tRNA(Ile)-lysidine synthase
MNGLLDRLEGTISRLAETTGGGTIVCAVSGGPDSVAMLLMLHEALPDTFNLVIAHFDHKIRMESGGDARWVEALASNMGLPFFISGENVPLRAEILRMNLEEAARDARRDFLRRLVRDISAVRIALGHNLDDQATTVLMNLVRGAGSNGLSGMEQDDGLFWRPVMGYWKSELVEYLADKNRDYLSDSSNDDLSLTRNRIEQVILPELQSINPGALGNILAASEIVKEQDEYIDELVDNKYGGFIKSTGDGIVIEDAYSLLDVILKTVLKKAYFRLDPSSRLLAAHYATVLGLGDGEKANLPGRITGIREGNGLRLNAARVPKLEAWYAELSVPGKVLIPDIGIEVIAAEEDTPTELPGQKANTVWFRPEVVGERFIVRSRRPGDSFRPSGSNGRRRIKDYLIDEKVPVIMRNYIPLVEVNGEIIWVVGHRIADGVSAEPGDKSISICVA